jgi:hypothetical protein
MSRMADLPRPKRDQETKPRKEKRSAILVDRVEYWNRPSLVIDGIDSGGLEKSCYCEAHCDNFPVDTWQQNRLALREEERL